MRDLWNDFQEWYFCPDRFFLLRIALMGGFSGMLLGTTLYMLCKFAGVL